jgi:hypothetical protein
MATKIRKVSAPSYWEFEDSDKTPLMKVRKCFQYALIFIPQFISFLIINVPESKAKTHQSLCRQALHFIQTYILVDEA